MDSFLMLKFRGFVIRSDSYITAINLSNMLPDKLPNSMTDKVIYFLLCAFRI